MWSLVKYDGQQGICYWYLALQVGNINAIYSSSELLIISLMWTVHNWAVKQLEPSECILKSTTVNVCFGVHNALMMPKAVQEAVE